MWQEQELPPRVSEMIRKLRSISEGRLWRALYLLAIFSFLLPFVTVYTTRCTDVPGKPSHTQHVRTGESKDYSGFQLVAQNRLFLFPIAIAALLLSLTFVRRQESAILDGFLSSWKATLSWLSAALLAVFPWLHFLPDESEPRIGQNVALASWALAYLASLIGALISLVHLRRSSEAQPSNEPTRYIASRTAYVIMILPAIGLLVYSILELVTKPYDSPPALIAGITFSISLPMSLAAYLLHRGLSARESWAVRSGRWAVWVLSTAGGTLITLFFTRVLNKNSWGYWIPLVWLTATALVGIGSIFYGHRSPVGQFDDPKLRSAS